MDLANDSNVVGKYLHDSTGAAMGGILAAIVRSQTIQ